MEYLKKIYKKRSTNILRLDKQYQATQQDKESFNISAFRRINEVTCDTNKIITYGQNLPIHNNKVRTEEKFLAIYNYDKFKPNGICGDFKSIARIQTFIF